MAGIRGCSCEKSVNVSGFVPNVLSRMLSRSLDQSAGQPSSRQGLMSS